MSLRPGTAGGDGYHSGPDDEEVEYAESPHEAEPLAEAFPSEHHMQVDETREDEEDGDFGLDSDSAYDSASLIGEDTKTLSTYITDYHYENGRRYHAYRDGAYWVLGSCSIIESSLHQGRDRMMTARKTPSI
jgi:hypothetical protein